MTRKSFTPKRVAIGSFLVFVAVRFLAVVSLLGIYDEVGKCAPGTTCDAHISNNGFWAVLFAYLSIGALIVLIGAVIKMLIDHSRK